MSVPLLEGTWQMIRAELGGEVAPELVTNQTRLELAAGKYLVRFDGELADRGSYALRPAETFAVMILRSETGVNAGRTIPCIYQLRGDRLRICYGLDGTAPSDFATSSDKSRYLAAYRRV